MLVNFQESHEVCVRACHCMQDMKASPKRTEVIFSMTCSKDYFHLPTALSLRNKTSDNPHPQITCSRLISAECTEETVRKASSRSSWDNTDSPQLLPEGRRGSGSELLLGLQRPQAQRGITSCSGSSNLSSSADPEREGRVNLHPPQ